MGEQTRERAELLNATHNEFGVLRLVTTRGNAIGLLSGGVLFPWGDAMPAWAREEKFHRDPGALIPEYLLLFAGVPGIAVTNELMDLAEDQFPVILEINQRYLAQPNLVVDHQYNVVPGQNRPEGTLAWLMHGLIPTAAIDRVVFRSQNELGEFRARPMSNFDPASASFEMRVNPNDFLDRTIDAYRIREAFWNGPDFDMAPVPTANATALGGAAVLVGSVAERRSDFPVPRMAELLDALRGPSSLHSPTALGVLSSLPDRLLPIPGKTISTGNMAELASAEYAFLLFLDELVAIQPREFVPMNVLGQVGKRLQQDNSPHAQILTLFEEVLNGFASINQVPEDTPDLLMAILDVCRAGGVPAHSSTADAPTLALDREIGAAILAGVLLGRDRVSIASRPTSKLLLDRLDGAIARRANEAAGSGALLREGPRITVETDGLDQERIERLLAGTHVLLERRIPFEVQSEVAHEDGVLPTDVPVPTDSATEQASIDNEKPEPDSSPATSDSTLAMLCERAGWHDLMALEFPEPLRYQMESGRGQETGWIRLEGVTLSQAVVIVDREKVSQRLASIGASLEESLRAELSRVLVGQVPEPELSTTLLGTGYPHNEEKPGMSQPEAPATHTAAEKKAVALAAKPTARGRKSSSRKPKDDSAGYVSADVEPETKAPTTSTERRRKSAAPTVDTEINLSLPETAKQAGESR